MCSRYSLTSPPEAVRAYFAYRETPNFPARYNIAPTQAIAVVCLDAERQARLPASCAGGLLPPFAKDPKEFPTLINARAEGVETKPAFRAAFAERRCLIPADGFYEWTGAKGKRRPFLLAAPHGAASSPLPGCGSAGATERAARSTPSRFSPAPPMRR